MSQSRSIKQPNNHLRAPRLALAINADEHKTFLEKHLDRLQATAEVVHTVSDDDRGWEELLAADPEILITAWSTPSLAWLLGQSTCRLKYVCHLTGSVRSLVPRAFIEQGGCVTNWGTLANTAVAEHALLLALAALRNLPAWSQVIAGPRQVPATRAVGTQSLTGRRIGIHGFGGVARALIHLLRPFTDSISSYSAAVPPDYMRSHGVEPCTSLAQLFGQSEVLFECEALTPQTRHSVSAGEFAALCDHAVFVNVARGDLVDEAALIREAVSGRLRVALDVVTAEPLSPQSAIARIKGVVLSPHIAGPTLDQYPRIGELAVANIERYGAGMPLQDLVTLEVFDRST